MTDGYLYLVAPASLGSWFGHFLQHRDPDVVLHVGEGPAVDLNQVRRLLPGRTAIFLSGHDSLLRDRGLADQLLCSGVPVLCQSHRATSLGVDKVLMKEFLAARGVATAPWGQAAAGAAMSVVKARHGTQSLGIRLVHGPHRTAPGEYAEPYLDGIEYSVLVYRDAAGCTVFPGVWKGATSPRLVPPWRRLRLCPVPALTNELDDELYETSRHIAEITENIGFMEIEYLLRPDGQLLVVELNPRISGTMRITAMATGVPLFSWHRQPHRPARPRATRYAAEVPHHGPGRCDPANGVFATSRLTVVTDAPHDLPALLDTEGADARWTDAAAWPVLAARGPALPV